MSSHGDFDPRPKPSDAAPAVDSGGALRPQVANARPAGGLGLILGVTLLLGASTFVLLNAQRTRHPAEPGGASGAVAPAPPPPPDLLAAEAEARGYAPPSAPAPSSAPAFVIPAAAAPTPSPSPSDAAALGRKAPALVVDLGDGPGEPAAAPAAGPAAGKTAAAGAAPGPSGLNADEQFAERVSASEPERSRATQLRNTQQTIPQGAMIPGVLETALDSDLPGYTRAVVSRDVRGFDGSVILVPRGSRVIGQYKSAVSQGQSRAFVIWTRIIRPDGASIQIASSGTDPLGRAGLEGSVNRHFFEQFGGAVMLSVINAGLNNLSRTPSTEVVIGSSTQATALGASALLPAAISPTIKVPQGAPIRIFVARDLDFSSVGAVK
jgi:type IV secretion system protein VirB10